MGGVHSVMGNGEQETRRYRTDAEVRAFLRGKADEQGLTNDEFELALERVGVVPALVLGDDEPPVSARTAALAAEVLGVTSANVLIEDCSSAVLFRAEGNQEAQQKALEVAQGLVASYQKIIAVAG